MSVTFDIDIHNEINRNILIRLFGYISWYKIQKVEKVVASNNVNPVINNEYLKLINPKHL